VVARFSLKCLIACRGVLREYSGACGEVGRGPCSPDATLKRRRSAAARSRVRHVGSDRDQFSRESTT